MTPDTEIDRLFGESLSRIPKPEAVMPIEKSPDFGHEAQEIEHGGVIDLNESTAGDRETVSDIRDALEKRDRNATPRTGGDEPEAA